MTGDRTTATVRRRHPLARALAWIGIVVVTLVAIGVVSGHAAASPDPSHAVDGQDDSDEVVDEEPPENVTYGVSITARSPDMAEIQVVASYEARSDTELERARNDTLAAEWFRGEEIVQDAMAARGLDTDPTDWYRMRYVVPEDDDAETITISYRVEWTDIPRTDDGRVRFGPGFAAALDSGDEFRVVVPVERWEDWTVNRERPHTTTQWEHTYVWTIGDDPDPDITLERGDVGSETEDTGVLGTSFSPSFPVLLGGSVLVSLLGVGGLVFLLRDGSEYGRW